MIWYFLTFFHKKIYLKSEKRTAEFSNVDFSMDIGRSDVLNSCIDSPSPNAHLPAEFSERARMCLVRHAHILVIQAALPGSQCKLRFSPAIECVQGSCHGGARLCISWLWNMLVIHMTCLKHALALPNHVNSQRYDSKNFKLTLNILVFLWFFLSWDDIFFIYFAQ